MKIDETNKSDKRLTGLRDLSRFALAALMLSALAGTGCTLSGNSNEPYFSRLSGRDAVETQLAGEALAQRKYSMRRIRRDMGSFRRTLEQLERHGKVAGTARFQRFAKPYIENRVDPLISSTNPTSHPELRPFHAELLLSKAILQHQMKETRALRATIGRLEREFESMGSMLVLYPTGEAVTLEQSIALVRMQTGEI